jgi:phosphoglycerate dehydrogenase-like enzyme
MALDTLLVLWHLSEDDVERLRKVFKTVIHHPNFMEPVPEDILQTVEVALMFMPFKGLTSIAAQMPKLKWIQLISAGPDRFLSTPPLQDIPKDLVISTAAGVHVGVIPPYVIMTMLSLQTQLQKQLLIAKVLPA